MEEDGEDLTPFWIQSSTNIRRRRRSSSPFLNSGVLVFLLCVTAVVFTFFIIPSILSSTAQIFRPKLVKKSWDSLNLVLVLFALVFGFLSRNRNYDSNFDGDHQTASSIRNEVQKSNPSTPHRWYEYSDRTAYGHSAMGGGLRRSFSSYPDLREVSPWDTADDDRWRFFDDTQVNSFRLLDSDQLRRQRIWKRVEEEEEGSDHGKTIQVDTLVTSPKEASYNPPPPSSPPSPPQSPSPSLTPPPAVHRKPRRTHGSIAHKERASKQRDNDSEPKEYQTPPPPNVRRRPRRTYESIEVEDEDNASKQMNNDSEPKEYRTPPPAVHRNPKRTHESIAHKEKANEQVNNYSEPKEYRTPPTVPTQPPPPPPSGYSEKKTSKSDRKRGGANATKDFLTSLYHQRKKKQRQKSVENFETLLQSQAPPLNLLPPPSAPPPPPPLPPPPSVFHNLFSSKKGKGKKIISIPPPPAPPPPPPIMAARASKTIAQIAPIAARKPPLPVKISSFNSVEENSNSGGESPLTGFNSPLIPIPPPPPPPPFKMPSWKFVVQGDYVKIGTMNSSRSGSPDLDDAESPTSDTSSESGGTTTAVEGGDAVAPLFCPSPDVNTKADTFIANFRAGLKLQKINSLKQKQGLGLSNLGPETEPGPGPS